MPLNLLVPALYKSDNPQGAAMWKGCSAPGAILCLREMVWFQLLAQRKAPGPAQPWLPRAHAATGRAVPRSASAPSRSAARPRSAWSPDPAPGCSSEPAGQTRALTLTCDCPTVPQRCLCRHTRGQVCMCLCWVPVKFFQNEWAFDYPRPDPIVKSFD